MHQFDKLPDSAFVRQTQLLRSVLPFSGTTLWRMVKDGHCPAPAKLGAGITAWRVGAVRAWLHERENGIVKSHSVGFVKRAALMTTWLTKMVSTVVRAITFEAGQFQAEMLRRAKHDDRTIEWRLRKYRTCSLCP